MSIRLRVAAVFTLAVAIAFAAGSWLLVDQLRAVMLRSADAGLVLQLSQSRQLLAASGRSSPSARIALAPGDYLLQLIDGSGRVRAASPEAGHGPLLPPAGQLVARTGRLFITGTIDGDPERILGAPFPQRPGWIAVAAVSLESADSTTSALVIRLTVGGLLFVAIAAAGAYLLARAALAPVDRLRREAAVLSEQDPAARLLVPGTRDEIAALAGTMNDLLERLQSALARQRAFVADAGHELRTPFAVLQGELELAERPGRSRAELADAVASAADEAARLSRLTDDLLLLASSDEQRLAARARPTRLDLLLAGSADRARHRAAAAGADIRVTAPGGLTARIDGDRIRQAVDNLIDNALRFAPAGSRIDLTAAAEGADITIAVTDAGPGFPADFLPRAFERFSRPDGGRARSDGGAGLGLAIVDAIAKAHGGSASARNRPGSGAEVLIELPGALLPAGIAGLSES